MQIVSHFYCACPFRSCLAAEALTEYLDVNEWQVERIRQAMESLDRREGMTHDEVKRLVRTWRGNKAPRRPKRRTRC